MAMTFLLAVDPSLRIRRRIWQPGVITEQRFSALGRTHASAELQYDGPELMHRIFLSAGIACCAPLAGCDLVFLEDRPCTTLGQRSPPMTDSFDRGTTRTWGSVYETAGSVRVEGALELVLSGAPGCVGIKSEALDACGMDFSIRIDVPPTSSATSAYAYFSLTTESSEIDFFVEDGQIRLPSGTIPFGPDHRYWRIRAGMPMVLLQTSPDGVTWTTQAQLAGSAELQNVRLDIGACCDRQEGSPGRPRFDDLNITP
jgi:hypothetical protein